jgi:large subunit ribosomal protein L24
MVSKSPRKQRKNLFEAPLQERRNMVSSHLSKELRTQYKRRSLPLRKGDEVKVMTGKEKGKTGKVSKINYKDYQVFIEGITDKRTIGTAVQVPFHASNLIIISPELNDEKRRKILLRKVKEVKIPEKPVEKKEEAKKETEQKVLEHEYSHEHVEHEGHEHHMHTHGAKPVRAKKEKAEDKK